MFDWFFTLLQPLEYAVAAIMVAFHRVFSAVGLPAASGWTWVLSIVGLVIVIRILLIPLFVKQIRASRGMQLIQPQMKKIQEKYKGKSDPESQADKATLFGAPLSETFIHAQTGATRVLTVVLIILMSVTTFTTQRQLMTKNMPSSALDNPFARQQKVLLYVLPLFFAISGVNFPIGVLIYWLTTNVWSMGQQFYVIRRMPAPGSEAEKALLARQARKRGSLAGEPAVAAAGD